MTVLLGIGDVEVAPFLSVKERKSLTEVRITEVEAARGRYWSDNEAADQLRELIGHEPTDVTYVVMTEEAWLHEDCIVNQQRDFFTACKEMWVRREDGTKDLVWSLQS